MLARPQVPDLGKVLAQIPPRLVGIASLKYSTRPEAPGFHFWTSPEHPDLPGVQLVIAYGEPGSVLPPHLHRDCSALMGVTSEKGYCELLLAEGDPDNGKRLTREKGVIFLPAGRPHGYRTDPDNGCEFYSLQFDKSGGKGILRDGEDDDFVWLEKAPQAS